MLMQRSHSTEKSRRPSISEKQRGGDTLVNMDDQGSRVGLNIVEDLTGKWKVKGYLEIGFNSDNGTYNQTTGNKPGTTLAGRPFHSRCCQ